MPAPCVFLSDPAVLLCTLTCVQHARTRAALSSEAAAYRRMADSLRGQLAAAEEACRRAGEREESAQVRREGDPGGGGAQVHWRGI